MINFLTKIYLYRLFDAFKLIGVLFALFFTKVGLSPFEISILIAIWSITTILTEVPMGTLADKYSRRNLLAIGSLLVAVGFWFWLRGGFVNYAIGFVLWGLKNTLTSGTLEAFVYDELSFYKKQNLYEKVSGRMSAYFSAGLVLSAIFGGIVAETSFSNTLYASILTSIIAVIVLFSIRDVKQVKSTDETNYYKLVKKAINQIIQNKRLLFVMIFIIIVFASYGAVDEFWNIIYEGMDLSPSVIGILTGAVYAVSVVSGYTVGWFKGKTTPYILLIVGSLIFIAFGLLNLVAILPFTFVAIYLFQVSNVKFEAQLQHNIESTQRATISSLKSFSFEVVYLLFVLMFGFIGTELGIQFVLLLMGAVVILTTLVFLVKKHFDISQ